MGTGSSQHFELNWDIIYNKFSAEEIRKVIFEDEVLYVPVTFLLV